MRNHLIAAFLSVLTLNISHAWAAPPTVDPTFGRHSARKAPSVPLAQASWIWADAVRDKQVIYLRKTVVLDRVPKSARIWIAADDDFALYVNGTEATHSPTGFATGYAWQYVQSVDIAHLLHPGRNILAVRAANTEGAAGVVAYSELNAGAPVATDAGWKVLDAADAPNGWDGADFDDSFWSPAHVVAPVDGGPWRNDGLIGWPGYAQLAPYLAEMEVRPTAVEALPDSGPISGSGSLTGRRPRLHFAQRSASGDKPPTLLLDFGREISGRVLIHGTPGAEFAVSTGESREECLKSPWGGVQTVVVDPSGKGASAYSAFRYATVTFSGDRSYKVASIVADHDYYPVQYQGSFACSDPVLDRIWYTGAYTAHLCMQEDIWDAPKRDRARWSGDLHVSGRVIDTVFLDRFLMRRTLANLRNDVQGGRPATDPPNSEVNSIPGYSAAWFCTLADYYRHTGDLEFIRAEHDAIVSLLDFQSGEFDADHLFANRHGAWPFVDWSPGMDNDSPATRAATGMFLIKGVREAAGLLDACGDAANSSKWSAWADTQTAAARTAYLEDATNPANQRLQPAAMAVYSGVADPAQTAAIYTQVLDPASAAWSTSGDPNYGPRLVSPYYLNYVLYAMSAAGHDADALKVIRSYWGGMLDEGATTFWEAYDPHWPKGDYHAFLEADYTHGYRTSLCHGWSTGPTSWLTECILGVRPTGAGYRTVEIAPDLCDLTWADGTVPTPNGSLKLHVARSAHGTTIHLELPAGITATVTVSGSAVTVNGKPADSRAGATTGKRVVVIDRAGRYEIVGIQ